MSRIQEASPQFEPVVCQQLSFILNRVTAFRVHFERTLFLALEGEGIQHYSSCINTATSETRTGPKRPKFSAGQEQIEALQCNGRFSWSEVARTFGVSERTLRHRHHELVLKVEGREYSNVADNELDDIVCEIIATTLGSGSRMVYGGLSERGLTIQWHRIVDSMHGIDPISSTLRNARQMVWRTYNVPCPNALW